MTTHERSYDVIVAGLGAMGSATMYALARAQGPARRVLGIDRFSPPHGLGSSHGRTRIIREAYFEHPAYVPIVRRAFDLWRELEQTAGRTLYTRTRGITLGPEDGMLVSGARASAEQFEVPHRVLASAEVTREFPGLQPLDGMVGVVEERAGVLFPEHCIAAMLGLAEQAGAELRRDETVVAWEAKGDGVTVKTTAGEYRAARLVIAAGAWIPRLVPELAGILAVARQPVFWFVPDSHADDYSAALGTCSRPVVLYAAGLRGWREGGGALRGAIGRSRSREPPDITGGSCAGGGSSAVLHAESGVAAPGVAGVSLHEHAGPAFHHRPASVACRQRGRGERVLGARVQVRDGDWRDRGGPGGGEKSAVRSRHVPHDPLPALTCR